MILGFMIKFLAKLIWGEYYPERMLKEGGSSTPSIPYWKYKLLKL